MKKIKTIFTIFTTALMLATANASNLEGIQAIDNLNVRVIASQDVVFSDVSVRWDISVIKDINVWLSRVSSENSKKVTLNLSNDLKSNFTYNLISAFGVDWDIDFTIWNSIVWEIANLKYDASTKGIEKINIVDSKTIEVYYNYEVKSDFLKYKILTELRVNSITSSGDNILNISLVDPLEKASSYMLMISSLSDIQNKSIEFDDYLFDFTTGANLLEVAQVELVELNNSNDFTEEWNVVDVALNAAETPDTGAATWVLMLLTFIFSSVFFLKNKFRKA